MQELTTTHASVVYSQQRITKHGVVNMMELQPPLVLGDKVWCPRCGEYVKVVRVAGAAKIVDVDRRTVYNYVKQNRIFAVRVAGSTLRVCSHCLLRGQDVRQPSAA